jgi:hypothetical protein
VIEVSSLASAALSSAMTLFLSWLVRRDAVAHAFASEQARIATETARVDELSRRVLTLESDTVNRRDLANVESRLTEIRQDLREVRAALNIAT